MASFSDRVSIKPEISVTQAASDVRKHPPAALSSQRLSLEKLDWDRSTTPVRIAALIRDFIATGRFVPGTRLIEADLTKVFGVSRHALREAIALLVGERLLTRTSFKGVEVTQLRAGDVGDIYTARRVIELAAVDALASARPEILTAVKRAIARLLAMGDHEDSGAMHLADAAVHAALVAALQSRRLSGAHALLMAELNILLFNVYGPDDNRVAHERHSQFGALIEAGDFKGARDQLDRRLRASQDQISQECRS